MRRLRANHVEMGLNRCPDVQARPPAWARVVADHGVETEQRLHQFVATIRRNYDNTAKKGRLTQADVQTRMGRGRGRWISRCCSGVSFTMAQPFSG